MRVLGDESEANGSIYHMWKEGGAERSGDAAVDKVYFNEMGNHTELIHYLQHSVQHMLGVNVAHQVNTKLYMKSEKIYTNLINAKRCITFIVKSNLVTSKPMSFLGGLEVEQDYPLNKLFGLVFVFDFSDLKLRCMFLINLHFRFL